MKKLLLIAIAALSFAAQAADVIPYNDALVKNVLTILSTESFKSSVAKRAAQRPTPGTYIACMQSLVIEELKKLKISFNEDEVRALVADLAVAQMMAQEQVEQNQTK